ncbi:hypothetical protein F4775DRAFT_536141 [Biscogniauxia sp. FL1348]|nr:hypothetical protein F4775DRAFT_536141 [Biscogniauxia sp. FL1348]
MHRALSSRWLNDALNIAERPSRLELPLFLCPSAQSMLLRPRLRPRPSAVPCRLQPLGASSWNPSRRGLHSQAALAPDPYPVSSTSNTSEERNSIRLKLSRKLPRQCSGCGAFSQFDEPELPGYYDLDRKAVRKFLGVDPIFHRTRQEDKIYEDALKHFDHKELEERGVDVEALAMSITPSEAELRQLQKPPLCDRCHFLMHHHTAESIFHPGIDSIRDTIAESPYKFNHVYHIVDAADFPMSVVPRITELLDIMPLRTKNRRAQKQKYYHDQITELSFVVTRSDLLAPTKEQVDKLFPYLQQVLRDLLDSSGKSVRLGNMFAVSSRRSWWTKELRETIWKRGGAGWMVGKANVGKSQLFEAVFPKGRMDWVPSKHQIKINMHQNPKSKEAKKTKAKESTTESTSETAPKSVPGAVQETAKDATPGVAQETQETPPEAELGSTPETPSELTPESTSSLTPDAVSESAIESVPEVTPEITSEVTPGASQETSPESLPQEATELAAAVTPEVAPKVATETTIDTQESQEPEEIDLFQEQYFDPYALLPPAPKEVQYPEMPLVSDLPGTTASPIRVPFGNGRGELIDLPGMERTGLEHHVRKEHRLSLIMKTRIVPEQITLKPGQSLLLGGFIRITPREPAPVMLTYAFTPIEPHVTRTDKAIEIQKQDTTVNVENIAEPGTGDKIALAGSFKLKWDVTRQRTGPLTNKMAVGLSVDRLPYRVLSTDILIEGVGWVEIVAQVRTRHLFEERPREEKAEEKEEEPQEELSGWDKLEAAIEDPKKKLRRELQKTSHTWAEERSPEMEAAAEPNWPIVDVYSPEGKYISCRAPMNGWNLNKPLSTPQTRKSRPRKSMKGVKKLTKRRNREREAAAAAAASSF